MKPGQEAYDKVLEALRNNEPELKDKDRLTSRILEQIRGPVRKKSPVERLAGALFSWVDVIWMRWSVSSLALVLTGVFFLQQYSLNRKISGLEKQLVHLEAGMISREPDIYRGQSLLMKFYSENASDSVTVSRSDLHGLLKSYESLLEKYEALYSGSDDDPRYEDNKENPVNL